MNRLCQAFLCCSILAAVSTASAGERTVVSLRDMSAVELKSTGFTLGQQAVVHVKALGGGGDYGWTYKSDKMFAYGWILNADTRKPIWKMSTENTWKSHNDRGFDNVVTLPAGNYEVYFTAYAFDYHTTFTHFTINVDHRDSPLFGTGDGQNKHGFFSWFSDLFSDDLNSEWEHRSKTWGIDLMVDESIASSITYFGCPKERPNIVLRATGVGDHENLRKAFIVTEPVTATIYAIGEGQRDGDLNDYGWIINTSDRSRVWDMTPRSVQYAGGARKNICMTSEVHFEKGEYLLQYVTDGSHSAADWNDAPPEDPLNYGVTVCVNDPVATKYVKPSTYDDTKDDRNIIVSLVKPGDDDFKSDGFTLKQSSRIRVYCIGERSNSSRTMSDYGTILDARTRAKVWTMDVDRTVHAGGASKNRMIDEVITLPKGSYTVTYTTDDSHSYSDWNDDPPYDADHYGITVYGVGENFSTSSFTKYSEEKDRGVIAQLVRMGDNEDQSKSFKLAKATRIRIYAIGEGQNREMFDYGWIEEARTHHVLWEMTYPMTFFAGGGRKNRMVNTTLLLEKGEYLLRWKSDDSHSYGDWNVDPPEDQTYWGITVYEDEGDSGLPPPAYAPTPDDAPTPDIPRPPRPPRVKSREE